MVSLWRSEVDWSLRSTPHRNLAGRTIDLERGKTLGGSSAINYMMWVRGARQDFDRWANEYGCGAEWSYAGVLDSFKRKAERDERIAEEKKRQRVLEWPAEKTKRTPKKKAVA